MIAEYISSLIFFNLYHNLPLMLYMTYIKLNLELLQPVTLSISSTNGLTGQTEWPVSYQNISELSYDEKTSKLKRR